LPVACNASVVTEPLLFYAPAHRRTGWEPREHRIGVRELTHVRILIPGGHSGSPEIESLRTLTTLSLQSSDAQSMILTFDHGRRQQRTDLHPALPLVVEWMVGPSTGCLASE